MWAFALISAFSFLNTGCSTKKVSTYLWSGKEILSGVEACVEKQKVTGPTGKDSSGQAPAELTEQDPLIAQAFCTCRIDVLASQITFAEYTDQQKFYDQLLIDNGTDAACRNPR